MAKTVGEEKLAMSAPQIVAVRELFKKSSENRRDLCRKTFPRSQTQNIQKWRLDFDRTIRDLRTVYIINRVG